MIGIYGLYVVTSGLVLAIFYKPSAKEWILKMVVVSFLPVIGWFLPIMWKNKWIRNRGEVFGEYIDAQDEDIQIDHLTIHEKIEKEKELNVISINDALIISENSVRRRVIIDVLKEDALNYLEVLQTEKF